ncbi:prophage lambdaba04, site-specific recombinase, phage integrase family domain protein [Clostridioides difficile CD160]|nr:prophage lambdaba04, site-specific recombinase, phage integrase family domain protein [Clostridioides difficile CD160]
MFHFYLQRNIDKTPKADSSLRDIQKRLSHNKITTTINTYSHVTNKMKTETVNIFEEIIN